MLETPHVLVASAIAVKIQSPALAIPMSLVSHFVFDIFPHWNPRLYHEKKKYGKPKKSSMRIVAADTVFAFVLGTIIAWSFLPNEKLSFLIFLSSFVAVLPDLMQSPFYLTKNEQNSMINKWINFKRSIQNEIGVFWGLTTQIIVSVAALYWIFN